MKNNTRLILAVTFSLVVMTAVWAIPQSTHNATGAVLIDQAAAQTQAATGTISAVDKASFTITLPPTKNLSAASNFAQDTPKTMTFVVDKNTTIEGKLRVGASAEVTYRDDNGEHIALGVRVSPPQS
jgi:Cu/Ag efflux protein CusF